MCCNFSKNAPPQYHPFASTWSSKNIEIPVQRILLGIIAADLGLNVFGGDATNSYVHSSEPDQNYLSIDKANTDWYKLTTGKDIDHHKLSSRPS